MNRPIEKNQMRGTQIVQVRPVILSTNAHLRFGPRTL
jgi:hypothetical protein